MTLRERKLALARKRGDLLAVAVLEARHTVTYAGQDTIRWSHVRGGPCAICKPVGLNVDKLIGELAESPLPGARYAVEVVRRVARESEAELRAAWGDR